MRYKPLLILLILFAFICGISSASASDLSNDTDMETYSAEITGINNENQSILTDTGNTVYANNWNELKTYCEKSDKNYIIHLKENTNFYPDNGTDYSQQIIVKNNVTIIGSEGSYFGDTNPNPISIYYTPIVTEDDSKISLKILNTTFKWMDLEKNIPAESGMFIQMGGNSKDNLLENSTFYNINSGTGHGCVYYLKRGYATVKNCSFKNITTEFGVLSIYDPAEDPTKNCTTAGMLVENCYFEDNYAHVEPGCINNCGQLIVKNSTFYKNSAFWWAGAIHTHGGANTTIYNSNFTDNVAGWNGGALYTYSYLQIYNTTFTGNNCTTNNGGGAIGACDYLTKYYITINNSLFENNANICKNTGRGGAISVMDEGGLIIHNTKFINNSASIGQAICAYYVEGYGDDPDIELINNTFINHTSAADTLTIKLKTGTNTTAILKNNTYLNSTIKLKTFNIVPTHSNIEINKECEFKVIIELENPDGYDKDILNKTFYKLYVNEVFEKEFGPEPTFKLNITQKETLIHIISTIGYKTSKNITITSRNTTTLTLGVKEINKTDVTIISTINPDATGNVVFTFQGKEYLKKIENGQATLKLTLMPGTYDIKVRYGGDKNYIPSKDNLTFTVDKLDLKFNITANDIICGENATVSVILPADVTGNVTVNVNNKNYTKNNVNGTVIFTISDLAVGTYNVTASFVGDEAQGMATAVFKVSQLTPDLNITVNNIIFGEDLTVEVNLPVDATGEVIITVDGKNYTVTIKNGKATQVVKDLTANNYTIAVKYTGNNKYTPIEITKNISVAKADSNITVNVNDIKVGENATVTVNVLSDATGNVIITVDGKDYTVDIVDGKAVKTIADLKANNYTVTVKYAGDNNYNPNQNTTKFTVSKISDYNMNITVPEFKEGVNSTISVVLPKDATGTVTVEINSKKYTANVTNGIAKVNIFGLSAGNHNITTTYSGDAKYDSITKKGNITVIPNVNVNLDVNDVVMIYHDGTRLVAKLTDFQGKAIVNATLYFTINGQTYNKTTDANGTASMGLNLASNVYKATVSYKGSDKYNAVSKNITVTINPTIISKDLVKMYQNDTRFYAKFTDSTGKALANTEIKFNINGVFYTKKTDKDGMADLGIMLRPGSYILTAYNPVTGEEKGFNITVKSLIMQNDLTKYYLNASRFEATVYNKDGSLAVNKEVTFNINGVFYHKKTDENGVASLGIALRPGEYTITTMYEGLDIGNKVNVLPTLVTKDLSMKYLDGSNFTAQTLDGQGKPLANQKVSFNVNGVFYHKVTNKDGIASLGIRLMSGEYIITSYWNDFQTGNTIKIS
ncbi:Ig-like domain repeat protein [Methanobrevibacter intestini]|uniref:Ig-like domain repeat protein n=1 Tax=Methanobrevibacter intestini TaxID=2911853 RepID=UPI003CF20417